MHAAQNLLVRPNHEESYIRRLGWIVFRERHRALDIVTIHVLLDRAIRVARDIEQYSSPCKWLIQTIKRYNREYLTYAPSVRERLEKREVKVDFVSKAALDLFENLPVAAVCRDIEFRFNFA